MYDNWLLLAKPINKILQLNEIRAEYFNFGWTGGVADDFHYNPVQLDRTWRPEIVKNPTEKTFNLSIFLFYFSTFDPL